MPILSCLFVRALAVVELLAARRESANFVPQLKTFCFPRERVWSYTARPSGPVSSWLSPVVGCACCCCVFSLASGD